MGLYFNIAQIIISVVLMLAILVQAKGSSLGGLFGGGDSASVFRTRRGLQRTLFNFTVGLAVVFVLVSLASVQAAS